MSPLRMKARSRAKEPGKGPPLHHSAAAARDEKGQRENAAWKFRSLISAFDVLYAGGELMIDRPLRERGGFWMNWLRRKNHLSLFATDNTEEDQVRLTSLLKSEDGAIR